MFYARPSALLIRQILADLSLLLWIYLWWRLSSAAEASLDRLAAPSRTAGTELRDLGSSMTGAGDNVGSVPYVGDAVRAPFDEAAKGLRGIAASTDSQVAAIEDAVHTIGWVVFAVPVALGVAAWLYFRVAAAIRVFRLRRIRSLPGGTDLLAARAVATLPLSRLARVPDPVGGLRRADPQTAVTLASLYCVSLGVRIGPPRTPAR